MKNLTETRTEHLPKHVCWSLLREGEVARIAFRSGESVDIVPVNFVVDHASIVLRTTPGGILSTILEPGCTVALEVDGFNAYGTVAWSVVAKGRAELITNTIDLLDAASLPLQVWDPGEKPSFIRIEPDSITGRRFPIRLTTAHNHPE